MSKASTMAGPSPRRLPEFDRIVAERNALIERHRAEAAQFLATARAIAAINARLACRDVVDLFPGGFVRTFAETLKAHDAKVREWMARRQK
jgi:hypothetical protein